MLHGARAPFISVSSKNSFSYLARFCKASHPISLYSVTTHNLRYTKRLLRNRRRKKNEKNRTTLCKQLPMGHPNERGKIHLLSRTGRTSTTALFMDWLFRQPRAGIKINQPRTRRTLCSSQCGKPSHSHGFQLLIRCAICGRCFKYRAYHHLWAYQLWWDPCGHE